LQPTYAAPPTDTEDCMPAELKAMVLPQYYFINNEYDVYISNVFLLLNISSTQN